MMVSLVCYVIGIVLIAVKHVADVCRRTRSRICGSWGPESGPRLLVASGPIRDIRAAAGLTRRNILRAQVPVSCVFLQYTSYARRRRSVRQISRCWRLSNSAWPRPYQHEQTRSSPDQQVQYSAVTVPVGDDCDSWMMGVHVNLKTPQSG